MMNKTFLVLAGHKATLVADANVVGGFYQNLKRPGETPDAAVNIEAGQTVEFGPFNDSRMYSIKTNSGTIADTTAFSGWADFSNEPPASAHSGTVASAIADNTTRDETLAVFKRTKLQLEAVPVTITDDPGVIQFGGVELFEFPQGNVIILSAKVKGNLTSSTGTLINAFTGNMSIGTTAAVAGATLATTQSDILPATAMTTAVNKVAAVDIAPTPTIPNSGARWADGRSAAKKAFLNVKIADDATHTSGTALFTGEVEIIWTASEVEA